MKHLIFRLYSPLASWGEIAVGGERHSSLHPSKSAVTGLLAAALGICRTDEKKQTALAEGTGIGIKVISGGGILNDYHTTQVAKNQKGITFHTRKDELVFGESISTVLSNREYRTDALSVVAVWQKKKIFVTLEELRDALSRPAYHLYLGRKSCPPALPLEPRVDGESGTLKEALDSARFAPVLLDRETEAAENRAEALEEKIFHSGNSIYFWEFHNHPGMKPGQKAERYDQLLSRERWQFSGRIEYMGFGNKEEK